MVNPLGKRNGKAMLQAHIFIGMLAFVNPRPAVVLIPDSEPPPPL